MCRKFPFSNFVVCVLLLAFVGFFAVTKCFGFDEKLVFTENAAVGFNYDDEESEIFELINKERRKYRLNSLEWNDKLAKIARAYSKKMARESYFGHYDSNGKSVTDRVTDGKIDGWRKVGENLFYLQGYDDYSGFVVRGWMRSASHRRNILDRNYNSTGIGIAESRSGEIYITQVFMQE